jgi:hypothetical protein
MLEPKVGVALILGIGLMVALSQSAQAELLVSGVSAVQGVTVGATFPDDHVFKLSAKSELKLLKSPDNLPFVMHGPFEGTLSKFVASCSGVLAVTRRHCRDEAAGDELPLGGSRSVHRNPY